MKLNIFISFCGDDREIKNSLKSHIINEMTGYKQTVNFEYEIIEMDTHCQSSWDDWMISAVKNSKIIMPIITEKVLSSKVEKRVLEEIAVARSNDLFMIPFVITDRIELPNAYQAHLSNRTSLTWLKYNYNEAELNSAFSNLISILKNDIKLLIEGKENSSIDLIKDGYSFATMKKFVGRENELKRMKELFDTNNVVILKGEPGIGKTTLAKQFFAQYQGDYANAYLFDTSLGLKKTISNLPLNNPNPSKDENERYFENINLLKNLSNKRIIILDNCNDDIDEDVLFTLSSLNCKFIITSRANIQNECIINVPPLTDDELTQIVYNIYPKIEIRQAKSKKEVRESLNNLFEYTERHTLTIEMVASILNNSDIDMDELNDNLLVCKEECLTKRSSKAETINNLLFKIFDVAALTDEQKRILFYMSLISPLCGISRRQLIKLIKIDNSNNLYELCNKLFLRFDEDSATLSLHQLFSDVVYLNLEPKFDVSFDEFISYFVNKNNYSNDIYENNIRLNYLSFMFKKRDNILNRISLENQVKFYCALAESYDNLSLYRNEKTIIDKLDYILAKDDSVENKEVFVYTKANYLCNAGDYKNTIELLNSINMELLQNNYLKVKINKLNSIANNYLGKFDEAVLLLKKALDDCNDILDIDDYPQVYVDIYNNLGNSYIGLMKYQESIDSYSKALELCDISNVYFRVGILSELLNAYRLNADNKKTKEIFEKIASIFNNSNLLETTWLADTHNTISVYLNECGEIDLALKYAIMSDNIIKRIYNNENNNIHMLSIKCNLSTVYYNKCQYEKSLDVMNETLRIYTALYGNEKNYYWMFIMNNLCNINSKLSNNEEALKYNKELLEMFEITYGKIDDFTRGLLYRNRATYYFRLNDYVNSLNNFKNALDIYRKVYPDEINYEIVITYSYMGDIYNALKDKECIVCYNKAKEIILKLDSAKYNQLPTIEELDKKIKHQMII